MNTKTKMVSKKLAISILFASLACIIMYGFRFFFKTDLFISDSGGISSFASVFGTLYGIMVAFVIFEVWSQFNKTSSLVDREGTSLERLFRLTLYIKDKGLSQRMKKAIKHYTDLVITDQFPKLAKGERTNESSKAFREISKVIHNINPKSERDHIVFQDIVDNYGQLSDIRVERINQSLAKLPHLLKVFLWSSSLFTLIIFITMPFSNMFYGFLTTGALAFIIVMVFQIIEDLDNPFVGFWTLSTEPFERAIKHIEEDY